MPELMDRLAVCSWSLQPPTPQDLIAKLDQIGIPRVQLALDPLREGGPWADAAAQFKAAGITVASGMMMTVGEDYTTPQTIAVTGGVVPDATWDASWSNIQAMAAIAQSLNLELVTLHAGFLPHDSADLAYGKLISRLRQIADCFSDHGLKLGFETGQEDAKTLGVFLDRLERDNVGVNFDPANMILYDMGDPIEALRALMPRVMQVHLKDANRTTAPGTWGEEVVVGKGQVDWSAFFGALQEAGYVGDLCIEREAGTSRVKDIAEARAFVSREFATL